MNSILSSAALSTKSWAERRGLPHTFTESTRSTNDDAKHSASGGEHLHLTAHQTHGRGRARNQWLDHGAGHILLSTWKSETASPPQPITGSRVGLALYRAARRAWPGLAWGLKAPNDLFVGRSKIAGLLIEVISTPASHRVLVGLGLNALAHPEDLGTATDLAEALGRAPFEHEWTHFLDAWSGELRLALADGARDQLSAEVRKDLREALNANAARVFEVTEVSARGDLLHAGGVVRWTDL